MTDTFTYPVQVGNAGSVVLRVLETPLGDGYRMITKDGLNAKVQSWPIVCVGTSTDVQPVQDFLDAHIGVSFYWTPPLNSVPQLFTCVAYQPMAQEGNNYVLTAQFEQAFRP